MHMLLSELSWSLPAELAQAALFQSSGGSSSKPVAPIQTDHKASVKKSRMQILSSVAHCAPEVGLMQTVCPGLLVL